MEITRSHFITSSPSVDSCIDDNKAEYAFIGRSNVGKSSLINMLCNHKGLAKTSSMPGKTMLINHFLINDSWYLVDLPGYGYAKRSKKQQQEIDHMIRGYITQREQLVNVFVLIDVRHPQQSIDRKFIDWLGEEGIPFTIIFTKADKLGTTVCQQNIKRWLSALDDAWEEYPPYILTSAEKKTGRQELIDHIAQINAAVVTP